MRIVALNRRGLALGIAAGMTLSDARAQLPDLIAVDHNLVADDALIERIADLCDRYTPMVAIDPPDGITLDITGCAHLFGSEAALAADLDALLTRLGIETRHALAASPEGAQALARHQTTPAASEQDALRRLPIAALRLADDTRTALRRAGLHTIGDLAARPLAPIAARFGEDAVVALDRLLGRKDSRISPLRPAPALFFDRRFAEPIAHTSMALTVIRELAEDAASALEHRQAGGRRFSARFYRSDGAVRDLAVETSMPTRDASAIARLFDERVDSLADPIDPGFGFDMIRLAVPRTEPLAPTQLRLEGGVVNTGALAELIDRLSTRAGRSCIRRFVPQDTHIPEQGVLALPAIDAGNPAAWPMPETGEPPLRPLHLFDPPQPVDVVAEVPDGPPHRFRWRRNLHEVRRYEGPERIAAEWWTRKNGGGLTRDYYRVEDARGRRFWIFRHGLYETEKPDPRWYVPWTVRVSGFAELVVATNYSFLHGASHPSDMVHRAMTLGLTAIGIADRNTVAGVVRAYVALRDAPEKAEAALLEEKKERGELLELTEQERERCKTDLRLVVGARLVFADDTPDIVAYPETRRGWGRLTQLLTKGNLRAVKGGCILKFDDLIDHLEDVSLIVLPCSTATAQEAHKKPVDYVFDDVEPSAHLKLVAPGGLEETLSRLSAKVPGRVWLGATMGYRGDDARRLARLRLIAADAGVPLLATSDALYADASRRALHDVLTCIRLGRTIGEGGRALEANAEHHVKSEEEMARLFRACPEAIGETLRLLERIRFTLDDLKYEYPHEPVPSGWKPTPYLLHLAKRAAFARYGAILPPKVRKLIAEEIRLIRMRNYAYYFLTVYDLVKFARAQDPPILCQGRGSAANSIVCFLLGVTSVDPLEHDLLFSRFVSEDRDEPPDIDVDFEHERREEVMQYIYRRYGRHRAGIAATVIHYRSRSAVREVAKVLGLSEDISARLAGTVWGSWSGDMEDRRFTEAGFDLGNPEITQLRFIMNQLIEAPFPRHLSQHVGGFVLTQDRLDETVPIHNGAMENRSFIEWDKDDIDALQLMKVDVLALGMLTCIRKSFDLMRANGLGEHTLDIDIKADDEAVYEMLQKGDSIGVFQVESRAQINMLPRLKPENLYDLTVQVAIVRPGPIEGDMVHPYLRRRSKIEKVDYPSPGPGHDPDELKTLLGKTYGVPLFQEQVMKLAIVAAAFTPSEANQLRRAMATFRNVGTMQTFQTKMVEGMVSRGYQRDFAERCYSQIKGFGSYGFPESHALSFARLVYVSSWIKCHQPAVFACALLNSQPMGFYAPAQIIGDARAHDVEVRPVDVNASCWDNSLERNDDGVLALRLGFRQITGFREGWASSIAAARIEGLFADIETLARRAALPQRALRLLADADAFGSIGSDRRAALWEVRRTPHDELPLFAAAAARELGDEQDMALPAMSDAEHVVIDYQLTRLSLRNHPLAFLRNDLRAEGVLSCAEIATAKRGKRVRGAGVVLIRQRPGKGNAIFVTLEDETGIINVVIWARLFETFRRKVMAARLMLVEGEIQRSPEGVTHLMASRIVDRSDLLSRLSETDTPRIDRARADIGLQPDPRGRHPRDVRILPRSRDFH